MSEQYKGKISGLTAWRKNLREAYDNSREQFLRYCDIYHNHERLGYDTPQEAWDDNPVIEGSVDPRDYRNVTTGFCMAEQDDAA